MNELPKTVFVFRDATLEVSSMTIGDDSDAEEIAVRLAKNAPPTALYGAYRTYADVLVTTRAIDGGLGLALPGRGATDAELQAGYDAFRALPRTFMQLWRQANTELSAERKAVADA
jgi:hypothetical protein